MSKMIDKSDSMNIRKATDNIEILMNGGELFDEGQDEILTFEELILVCKSDGDTLAYTLNTFAELIEYTEPMTERELAQAKEIEELKAQIASGEFVRVNKEISSRKKRVKYARSDEMKIAQDWKYEKSIGTKLKKKDFAKKYNISGNYLTSILVSFGVETKRRNNTKVNASIDTDKCDG